MNRALRTLISSLVAAAVTFGLFLSMIHLASSNGLVPDPLPAFSAFSFEQTELPPITEEPPPDIQEPPEPADTLPSVPVLALKTVEAPSNRFVTSVPGQPDPDALLGSLDSVKLAGPGSPGNGAVDAEVVPRTRFQPVYPREPLLNGVEGFVLLEFTITPDGRVEDVVVADAEPARVFDRAAKQAILEWTFEPRTVDGKAIARRAVQRLEFRLE